MENNAKSGPLNRLLGHGESAAPRAMTNKRGFAAT
jgi:hypothetical protein